MAHSPPTSKSVGTSHRKVDRDTSVRHYIRGLLRTGLLVDCLAFRRQCAEGPRPHFRSTPTMNENSHSSDFAEYFAQFQRSAPAVAHIDEKVQDAQKL